MSARQPFPSWLLTGLEKLASIVVVQKPWPMLCSLYFFLILFLFFFLLVPYFFPIFLFSSFLFFSYFFSTFIILMISKKCWLLNDMGQWLEFSDASHFKLMITEDYRQFEETVLCNVLPLPQ